MIVSALSSPKARYVMVSADYRINELGPRFACEGRALPGINAPCCIQPVADSVCLLMQSGQIWTHPATAPLARKLANSLASKPHSASTCAVSLPGAVGGLRSAEAVRLKRGTGWGCVTPSTCV